MGNYLEKILKYSAKPALFEPGEVKFWDDPHISASMLEAHLDPESDSASRKPHTIESTVSHLLSSGILKPGMRLLDLGCGPGLYAERLSCAGVEVVGLDISRRSLDYAAKQARDKGLNIEYRCMNFFDMDYIREFDAVIQVYGELCVFSDERRDKLLGLIHRALKDNGVFIFDVTTRDLRKKHGLKKGWYASNGGFWRPGCHLVLEVGLDYPEADVWLDQYIVIDDRNIAVYRNWFHDYSKESIEAVLEQQGFKTARCWNDFTGNDYEAGGDWIAIEAVKM